MPTENIQDGRFPDSYMSNKKIKVCKVQSRAKQEKSLIFQHCKAIVGSYTVIILWKIQTKFVTIQTKAAQETKNVLAWGDQLCCLKWSCVWKERFQCRLTFIGNLLQETFDFLCFSTIKIRSSIWGFSIFVSSLQQETQQTPYSTSFLSFEQLWTILCQKTRHSQVF